MRRPAAVMCVLVLAISGCGGDDDEEPATTAAGTSGATGASGESGAVGETVAIDGVVSCLEGEGLEANVQDSELIGIDVPYEWLEIPLEDLEGGAAIIVYDDAATAEDQVESAGISAGISPVQASGNTVWGVDAAIDDKEGPEKTISGCLP